MYCVGGYVDKRGMRDREEQLIYGIRKSTRQDEASYDSKMKKDQVLSREQRRRRDEGDGGQVDRYT